MAHRLTMCTEMHPMEPSLGLMRAVLGYVLYLHWTGRKVTRWTARSAA